MQNNCTYISFADDLGASNPASINRATGHIKINRSLWFAIPDIYKRLILEHEKGHYFEQTRSELEADEYAFNRIAGTEQGSLRNVVMALNDLLKSDTPLNKNRIRSMLKRACVFDYKKYGNINALKEFEKLNTCYMSGYEDDFLGLGNKKKKEEKQKLKEEYGKGWRKNWKEEKTAAGGGKTLRQQFRSETKDEKAGLGGAADFDITEMAAKMGVTPSLSAQMASQNIAARVAASTNAKTSDASAKKILGLDQTTAIIIGVVLLLALAAGSYFIFIKK